jgi:uncharacterized protein (DUF1501 family)
MLSNVFLNSLAVSAVSGSAVDVLTPLKQMMDGKKHLLEKAYSDAMKRGLELGAAYDALRTEVTYSSAAVVNGVGSAMRGQLSRVLEAMKVGKAQGLQRQTFFVAVGGFDTHGGTNLDLMHGVCSELTRFYQYLDSNPAAFAFAKDKVTAFTASDFGRTFSVNESGSDHAWGADHFIMGPARVAGGIQQWGTPFDPLANGVVNRGVMNPTTALATYLGALTKWFLDTDASASTLNGLFPYVEAGQTVSQLVASKSLT